VVATLLELIPVASIFFSFTNSGKQVSHYLENGPNMITVGAALWAADIEANSTNMTELRDARAAGESFKKDL